MPARKKSLTKSKPKLRLTGVELYFEDLPRAKQFYKETLGLELADESVAISLNSQPAPHSCVSKERIPRIILLSTRLFYFSKFPISLRRSNCSAPIASCAMSPRPNPDDRSGRCCTTPRVTISSFSMRPIENPTNVASLWDRRNPYVL